MPLFFWEKKWTRVIFDLVILRKKIEQIIMRNCISQSELWTKIEQIIMRNRISQSELWTKIEQIIMRNRSSQSDWKQFFGNCKSRNYLGTNFLMARITKYHGHLYWYSNATLMEVQSVISIIQKVSKMPQKPVNTRNISHI